MDLSLTDEQTAFRDALRKFAQKEIAPLVEECEDKAEYPRAIFQKMAEPGYLGARFPVEFGGSGGDTMFSVIMSEELAYVSPGIYLGVYVHLYLALSAILFFGKEEQKQKYLVPGIKGDLISAWAFAEPSAGSDPGSMTTRAHRDGDDFVINGTKMFITNGTFADFVVVTAVTDPSLGMKGISLFIVDRDTPGFSVSRKLKKMGMKASEAAELVFEDCRVPATNMLGREHTGFLAAMGTLTEGRIVAAAFAVGMARAAHDAALAYAKIRPQFGQPIGKFQGLQWMLADMATQIEAAKLLTYQAAWLASRGAPHIKEASMAKLFATETATQVCAQAVQIHGGYGFMDEYPVSRFYRDCKLLEIGEGTSQIHRNTIAKTLGL
ncbi:MAG: acyl-CoA dehydrogenase family protein [Proteobacteria bacterium]|nr:acyl-CoA dehydrogenase family protein [Pseudomonadota bacterium]MBU1740902.1 acyl-CoA dehydrogenase family protein [Pseudomonadota bacterium]